VILSRSYWLQWWLQRRYRLALPSECQLLVEADHQCRPCQVATLIHHIRPTPCPPMRFFLSSGGGPVSGLYTPSSSTVTLPSITADLPFMISVQLRGRCSSSSPTTSRFVCNCDSCIRKYVTRTRQLASLGNPHARCKRQNSSVVGHQAGSTAVPGDGGRGSDPQSSGRPELAMEELALTCSRLSGDNATGGSRRPHPCSIIYRPAGLPLWTEIRRRTRKAKEGRIELNSFLSSPTSGRTLRKVALEFSFSGLDVCINNPSNNSVQLKT
jgi:hypothetical protein